MGKWGEFTGIDNLILLSSLLNISLDELITGEAYLSFPLHYGKPQSAKPAIILITILVSLFIGSLVML